MHFLFLSSVISELTSSLTSSGDYVQYALKQQNKLEIINTLFTEVNDLE